MGPTRPTPDDASYPPEMGPTRLTLSSVVLTLRKARRVRQPELGPRRGGPAPRLIPIAFPLLVLVVIMVVIASAHQVPIGDRHARALRH
jgi:hypothetical protein